MSKLLLVCFHATDAEAGAGFAQQFGLPFDILAFEETPNDLGASICFLAKSDDPPYADSVANLVASELRDYTHYAAVSSMASKDAMARVAGKLDAAMVTDAIGILSQSEFTRPVVAGAAIEVVETKDTPVVITFRPAGFEIPKRSGNSEIKQLQLPPSRVYRVASSSGGGARPDLTQAKVIVSGGRPLKDAATFESVIGGLADALGGAAGATRAAVDSGIAANELQVGQTGKIVAPDLYIAAGISGSTQHMAGIKDSKCIVAINKDPDAPIFESADLGLVADLFEAIPELRKELGI